MRRILILLGVLIGGCTEERSPIHEGPPVPTDQAQPNDAGEAPAPGAPDGGGTNAGSTDAR
jgi:hypothetical protein